MQKTFLIGKQSDADFNYQVLNTLQKKDCIKISQKDYINSIEFFEIPIKCQQYQKFHQLNKEEKLSTQHYWQNELGYHTKPDIRFDVIDFSISMNKNFTILD